MMRRRALLALLVFGLVASGQAPKPKTYRLPSTSLKPRVIWGAVSEPGEGVPGLAFGGQDQESDDGNPHTRLLVDGKWQAIHEELRKCNPFDKQLQILLGMTGTQRRLVAAARANYLQGQIKVRQLLKNQHELQSTTVAALVFTLQVAGTASSSKFFPAPEYHEYHKSQIAYAMPRLHSANAKAKTLLERMEQRIDSQLVHDLWRFQIALEQAAEALDAEPAPRALSPLAYDAKSKLFVLFGGDHLDYLTNDTWVFDPAKKQWQQRHPENAPPPRANHVLKATGDGKIALSGGYTYTSNTGYVSGQYRDFDDGDWTYDVAANKWTGTGKASPPDERTYRTGPFHPDFYLTGDKPDAAAFQKRLADLPANVWTEVTGKDRLPQLNRDWGSACLDTDRDLILRFSGGHSAHGGSDVLHFHLATGRWELCFPVEFPLGQLYSNTEYPEGFNFNRRPWVTGHTYQNYGYDQHAKKLIFTGRTPHAYVYDPAVGDWIGRKAKPKPMVYNDCFYTLTLCSSPHGLYCWTPSGKIFHYNAKAEEWDELKLDGKLQGSVVDNSTITYDGKRDRLLTFAKPYGKPPYSGSIQAVDLKTLKVSDLPVKNKEAAAAVPYLCQIRYDPEHDLLLVGGFIDDNGTRRTPIYDCAKDEWLTLELTGNDPNGKGGRNVSLGMMYDASRKLFWAVDTNSRVYALKLDPKSAKPQPLK